MRIVVIMDIDRYKAGQDVTNIYPPDVERLLIKEGYLKAKWNKKAHVDQEEPDEPQGN